MPDISVEATQSLEHFARRHGLDLTRFAYCVSGDHARADDLVQDVLLAMQGRFGSRLDIEQPLAYARRAVVDADVSWSRRLPDDSPHWPAHDLEPGSGEQLWQLLADLPHRQRVVLVLRHYLGHDDDEIAGTLGCRRGTVRSLASRALADLRASSRVYRLGVSDDGTNRWAAHDDGLHRRLVELFQQRAATVVHARRFDLGHEGSHHATAAHGPAGFGTLGKNLALWVAAAVVVVAAGVLVGMRASQHGEGRDGSAASGSGRPVTTPAALSKPPLGTKPAAPSKPPLGTKPCVVVAPESWRQAIAAGALPVNRGSNEVLSSNSATGDYLVRQGNRLPGQGPPAYEDVELTLFHGAVGRSIFSGGIGDVPKASTTGAISADWITFSLGDPGVIGDLSRTVMLYERASGRSTVLARLTDQHRAPGEAFLGRPVIAAGKVYWLSGLRESTSLESWDLASGLKGGSAPAANAVALISYGSGVILYHGDHAGYGDSPTRFSQGPGTPLSSDALAALPQGAYHNIYTFDGIRTLAWLREETFSTSHASLDVGSGSVRYRSPLRLADVPDVVGFPLIGLHNGAPKGLLDLRAGSQLDLPAGLTLQAVVGNTAVFGTGGLADRGSAGLSLAPLSALPPVRC